MIIFLYTNKTCEHQAISCIKSMTPNITDDIKIVYFTIGFISSFEHKNLVKVAIPERNYPTFHFYKAELSLDIIKMFPEEQNFIFTDTDILFSRKVNFSKLVHTNHYALGVYGPHEHPYIWERDSDGNTSVFDEGKLMQYFNVPHKSARYQWSCFYAFNRDCVEFFEEYTSMCKNEYLVTRRKWYYPFHDETAFNVCIWKRGGTESLGYIFVNTHNIETVKLVEGESSITEKRLGKNLDELGQDWEYIHNSNDVVFYHGFKEETTTTQTLNYLLER